MAYLKVHETNTKRNGKPVKRYAVVWREPVRDEFGLPVPENLITLRDRCACGTAPSGSRPAKPRRPGSMS